MTKHMTKKATQHKVTTGTFLMVARFMGVLSCARKSSSEFGTSSQARTHSINSDSLRDTLTQRLPVIEEIRPARRA